MFFFLNLNPLFDLISSFVVKGVARFVLLAPTLLDEGRILRSNWGLILICSKLIVCIV